MPNRWASDGKCMQGTPLETNMEFGCEINGKHDDFFNSRTPKSVEFQLFPVLIHTTNFVKPLAKALPQPPHALKGLNSSLISWLRRMPGRAEQAPDLATKSNDFSTFKSCPFRNGNEPLPLVHETSKAGASAWKEDTVLTSLDMLQRFQKLRNLKSPEEIPNL